MNIEMNDSIILDNDKEYVVSSIALYDGIEYLYLINMDDFTLNFAALSGNQVVMLDNKEDKELIKRLLPLFLKNSAEKYQEMANEEQEN